MTSHEKRLLALLGTASFFNQYDQGLLSLLLVQIQADLAIPEAQLGALGSIVRLGQLPAFAALLLADRFGRRRLLLGTIAGYTLFTAATAFAPDFSTLVAFQFVARMFMTAEYLLAMVVIVEEFRPGNRAMGVAILGTIALCGRGVAMILFGAVDAMPFGWRGLYAVGVLPLLATVILRRGLAETRRFTRQSDPGGGSWLRPGRVLLREHRVRLAAAAAVAFLWSLSNSPVDFFLPKYFQEAHGWAPARFAALAVFGGALGLTGQLVAGWVSDRRGRRPTLVLFSILEPLGAIALYAAFGPLLFPLFVVWLFSSVGNDVVGGTARQELFPTSSRATAAGICMLAATLGGVVGLAGEGFLFGVFGSHWLPVQLIAATGLVVPWIVLAVYPETSGRVLEEIAPEPGGGSAGAGFGQEGAPRSRAAPRVVRSMGLGPDLL